MAIYRQVYITFWQDPFIMELTPEEKYFYLYLMTNSKTKQCGCYELPKKIMEFETGYNRETVDKLLDRFINYNKIKYDEDTNEILLMNWHKYNNSRSPKIAACIKSEIQDVKSVEFKEYCIYTLSRSTDTLLQQEEEQEEEKEQKQENKTTTKRDREKFFHELWKLYPRKKGIGGVSDTQKEKLYKIGRDEMERCIDRFIRDMAKENRPLDKYPYGSTFFNSGYVDYLDINYHQDKPPTIPKRPVIDPAQRAKIAALNAELAENLAMGEG